MPQTGSPAVTQAEVLSSPPETIKYQRELVTLMNVSPIATASIMLRAHLVVCIRQEQDPLTDSGHHQSPASPHTE